MNNTFTSVSTHQRIIFNQKLVSPAQIKDTKFIQNLLTIFEILEQPHFEI